MLLTGRHITLIALGVGVGLACAERPAADQLRSSADSASARVVPTSAAPGRSVGWNPAFGNFVAYSNGDSTIVALLPSFADGTADTLLDASSANDAKIDMFAPDGFVGSAIVGGLGRSSDDEGCFVFSRGQVRPVPRRPWSVALPVGAARALELELLDALHGTDSVALAQQIIRLAALVPGAADSIWNTAPFRIEQGSRITLADTVVIAASVMRMLPGPEHYAQTFFLVAEVPKTASDIAPGGRLAYVHPNRSNPADSTASGLSLEDDVGVVAAVRTVSDSMPILFLETRGNEVNGYAALGRVAPNAWRVVWNGPHEGGC